jgi:phage replication-related protein YjqB (UPF0714/DUF867 family)
VDTVGGVLRALLENPNVDEVCELRGSFGLMAIHGGNLERTTDVIGAEVAARCDASFYAVIQHPPLREHLPSIRFDPGQSETLAGFIDHVDVVIALHGYGREKRYRDLLLGGRNRILAEHLAIPLRAGLPDEFGVVTDLAAMPPPLRGQHRDNPVNLPRDGGVQIELPPTVRWNREERNWSDHDGTGRAPQVTSVIEALVTGVSTW